MPATICSVTPGRNLIFFDVTLICMFFEDRPLMLEMPKIVTIDLVHSIEVSQFQSSIIPC